MLRYIEENEIYKLFNARGLAQLHVADIDVLPRAEVKEVVHGRWHDVYMTSPTTYTATCSVCNVRNDIPHPWGANYCPNCGAKMDK